MISRPVKRGDNQVFIAIIDATGNEIAVCTTEEICAEIMALLNAPNPGIQADKEVEAAQDHLRNPLK